MTGNSLKLHLNKKSYPQMITIRPYFPQIRALFSNFGKKAGKTLLPFPHSSYVSVKWKTKTMELCWNFINFMTYEILFSTLTINFSEVWPRQILDLGKQFNLMIRLENVLKISLQDVLKMSWRRLEDVFKTSWRRLEDVLKTF